MPVEELTLDRKITVPAIDYTSPLTRDRYVRAGYAAQCSTQQTDTPNKNYRQVLSLVLAGHRMSVLDEIAYLIQREAELRAEDKNPREALKDPLFARQIEGNPYRWNWNHVALRAPDGRDMFPIESDGQGRKHGRGDYVIGDKVIAEGVRIPVSQGGKVVAIDPVLRIPAEVSDGNEPQHTTHWYFDPQYYDEKKEVAVRLGGCWYGAELDGCLYLAASYGRSLLVSAASFRQFQGSLDEVPIPQIEYYVKDRKSYEKGVRDGTRQERERIARELTEFSAKD